MKCEYCNLVHDDNLAVCPPNRRDSLHYNKDVDTDCVYNRGFYGQRLKDGFDLLDNGENLIINKFGHIHNSGSY